MAKVNIYLAGDSTVQTYSALRYPRMGWGQVLPNYFTNDVYIENHSEGGRSSKSFIEEGRLQKIDEKISKGDYLFIQFGHNDSKPDELRRTEPFSSYKEYLMKYIETARKHGAYPILFTSVVRRSFDDNGNVLNTHGAYPAAMRELAKEQNVPLIDLCAKTTELYNRLGPDGTIKLHMIFDNSAYKNYGEGCFDNTHFCEYGAAVLAKLVVEGIKEINLEIKKYLR